MACLCIVGHANRINGIAPQISRDLVNCHGKLSNRRTTTSITPCHGKSEIEERLLNNLAKLNITRITIAHRSKAMAMASRTVVVASGNVQEVRMADAIEGESDYVA
jgi:hypothetical protein